MFNEDIQGEIMARIVIRDLPENVDLDRQAMLAISGGSRFRSAAAASGKEPFRARGIALYRSLAARMPASGFDESGAQDLPAR
jgi:hypothetical protein